MQAISTLDLCRPLTSPLDTRLVFCLSPSSSESPGDPTSFNDGAVPQKVNVSGGARHEGGYR